MRPEASSAAQDRRDPACVERWPECESGAYDPRCCRFPKECVCTSYPPDESPAASTLSDRDVILAHVSEERDRQDAKWGGVPGVERRDDHTYAAVLGEEFGEVCQAWLQRDVAALREELVQTAAVAVAWVEEIDNGGGLARAE